MKALVGAFNQEKALVGAFSVIVKTGCGTDGSICGTRVQRGVRSGGDGARPRPRHPQDLRRVAPLVTRVHTQGAEQRKKVGGSICLKQQPAGG